MLKEGIIIGERYEIISRVGSGGMADVYKAKDCKLDRMVAIKILKAEFREDVTFIEKFRKEAKAAAGLLHPNVVNVFDMGEDKKLYYIVMELIEGITLKDYITKKGKLSVKEATSIAIQISFGMETAHNCGIIHRDIKPQNIIISTDGKVKISDFGIAKVTNSNTVTTNMMGSVYYSSLEQVRGGFFDAKSDIYSLGIMMYEMVTGRVPFDGDTTVSIAIKHLQEEMIPPSRYMPDLPYSLEQIILKCTQKDPERRYANMALLIEDLKHSLIDPQGDFVALTSLNIHAQTVKISDREMEKIREGMTFSTKPVISNSSRYDYYDENDYGDDDAVSSNLRKSITIGEFLIRIVIIIVLVVVTRNMMGLFNNKLFQKDNSASTSISTNRSFDSETEDEISVSDFQKKMLKEIQKLAKKIGIKLKQIATQVLNKIYEEADYFSECIRQWQNG